jgi:hypothetical protein
MRRQPAEPLGLKLAKDASNPADEVNHFDQADQASE